MNPSEVQSRPPEVVLPAKPELAVGPGSVETRPETVSGGEAQHSGPSQDPVASPPVIAQLPPVTSLPQQQPVTTDDNPLIAADDEVIEQDWVQKAKKIVAQTKGDPYSQEKEVGKLQADYIKKRYGKDIKLASD